MASSCSISGLGTPGSNTSDPCVCNADLGATYVDTLTQLSYIRVLQSFPCSSADWVINCTTTNTNGDCNFQQASEVPYDATLASCNLFSISVDTVQEALDELACEVSAVKIELDGIDVTNITNQIAVLQGVDNAILADIAALEACCIANSAPIAMDNLTDADTTTTAPVNGDVLTWNGTNWVPAVPAAGHPALTLTNVQDLNRVTLNTATQVLNIPPAIGARIIRVGASQPIPANVFTQITGLTNLDFDSVGTMLGTPNVITVPKTGRYHIIAAAGTPSLNQGEGINVRALINGATAGAATSGFVETGLASTAICYIPFHQLNAGDQIGVAARTGQAGGVAITGANVSIEYIEGS